LDRYDIPVSTDLQDYRDTKEAVLLTCLEALEKRGISYTGPTNAVAVVQTISSAAAAAAAHGR